MKPAPPSYWSAHRFTDPRVLLDEGGRRIWSAVDGLRQCRVLLKGVDLGPLMSAPTHQAESAGVKAGASAVTPKDSALAPLVASQVQAVEAEFFQLRSLAHPSLPQALDLLTVEQMLPDGRVHLFRCFSQTFLEGQALTTLSPALDLDGLQAFAEQALALLDWLQRQGFVHIDLKPDHFIRVGDRWYLIDLEQLSAADPFALAREVGTPGCMAPELMAGNDSGAAADIYSLGAVFFYALTGTLPPTSGATLQDICRNIVTSPIPRPSTEAARRSPLLASLLPFMLEPLSTRRPSSVSELLTRAGSPLLSNLRKSAALPAVPLEGRGGLLERIDRWLQRPASEGGGLLLHGPRGVGGSRLLAHLAGRLNVDQGAVLFLSMRSLPSGGLLESVLWGLEQLRPRGAVESLRIDASASLPDGTSDESAIAQTALEEQDATAEDANVASIDPFELESLSEAPLRRQLKRLFYLVHQLCSATGASLYLLVDEVERCSAIELKALKRLLPLLPDHPLRLILLVQSDAAPHSLVSAPFFEAEVEQTAPLLKLALPPLSSEAVRRVVEATLGGGSLQHAGALNDWMRHSQGLPGRLTRLLLRRWREPGVEDWRLAEGDVDGAEHSGPLPSCLQEVQGLALAQLLAVLPIPVPAQWLQLMSGWKEAGQCLPRLLADGVVTRQAGPSEGSEPLWQLDPRLRERLLSALTEGERVRLAGRAAEVLERRSLSGQPIADQVLSGLFLQSKMPERARIYLRRGAERAREDGQVTVALSLLTQLHQTLPADEPERAELALEVAALARQCARDELGVDYLRMALEGADWLSHEQQLQARLSLAYALTRLLKLDAAYHETTLLQTLLSPENPLEGLQLEAGWLARVQAHTLLLRGWLSLQKRGPEKRADVAEAERCLTACERLRPLPERLELRRVHLRVAIAHELQPSEQDLRLELEQALSLASGHPREERQLLNQLMEVNRRLGRLEPAEKQARHLLRLAREAFEVTGEIRAEKNLSVVLLSHDKVQEAYQHAEHASRLASRMGLHPQALTYGLDAVEALLEAGRLDAATLALERLKLALDGLKTPPDHRSAMHRLLSLRLALRRGQLTGLMAEYETLSASLMSLDARFLVPHIAVDRLELAVTQARERDVARLYAALPPEVFGEPPLMRRVHRLMIQVHQQALGTVAGSESHREPEAVVAGAAAATRVGSGTTETSRREPGPEAGPVLEEKHGGVEVGEHTGSSAQRRETAVGTGFSSGLEVSSIPPLMPDRLAVFSLWLEHLRQVLEPVGEPEVMAERLARLAGELVRGRGLVFLFDPTAPEQSGSFKIPEGQQQDISSTVIHETRLKKKPYLVEDLLLKGRVMRSLRAASVRSVACVPILVDQQCAGVIYVDSLTPWEGASERYLELIQSLAGMAGRVLSTNIRRRRVVADASEFGLVGSSKPMQDLRRFLKKVAELKNPQLKLLLLGEKGTGKSTVAESLHKISVRSRGPFIDENCASVPETIAEAVILGCKKELLNGAQKFDQPGWFWAAQGGTLFMDEVALMPLSIQQKLLVPLQTERFTMLGDPTHKHKMDFQLICATNADIPTAIAQGLLREDFCDRIAKAVYHIPPLRDRLDDVPELLAHGLTRELKRLKQFDANSQALVPLDLYFTDDALSYLKRYEWPGNVRQLGNLFQGVEIPTLLQYRGKEKITRSVVMHELELANSIMGLRDSKDKGGSEQGLSGLRLSPPIEKGGYWKLKEWSEEFLRKAIRQAWEMNDRNVKKTSEFLDCSRDVIYKWVPEAKG